MSLKKTTLSATVHEIDLNIIMQYDLTLNQKKAQNEIFLSCSKLSCSLCFVSRIRHPAGHHGEGGTKQLAGQRHLRGKLQRRQLPTAAGGPGPQTGEEVCNRP